MQWSDYLVTQPEDEAAGLVNDLMVGYGTLTFMVRQLTRNGELREVVATLGRAELALDRAYRRLPEPRSGCCCRRHGRWLRVSRGRRTWRTGRWATGQHS